MKALVKCVRIFIFSASIAICLNYNLYSQHILTSKFDIKSDCRTSILLYNKEKSIEYTLFDNRLPKDMTVIFYYSDYDPLVELRDSVDLIRRNIYIPMPILDSGKYFFEIISCDGSEPEIQPFILMR